MIGSLLQLELNVVNMTSREASLEEICEPARPGLTTLTEQLTMFDMMDLCMNFGGQVAAPNSDQVSSPHKKVG